MAGGGKRKTHWAARRKTKQARRGDNDSTDGPDASAAGGGHQKKKNDGVDRRLGFSDEIHPGSYAAQRKRLRDSGELTDPPVVPDAPKRRFGMWIAFCGKDYSGMQMNEGVQTIEAELERALFEAGAIAESNYGFLQKIGWSRAGRTDKGVHAAGQMVSAKLHVPDDVPAFIATVNAALPDDIRVMHMVTTTKNFNAKMACDKRTYEYLAPSFMFASRDIVTPPTLTTTTTTTGADHSDDGNQQRAVQKAWSLEMLDRDGDDEGDDAVVVDATTLARQRAYRMSDETYLDLLRTLKEFEGTHNFHNFTSKLEPSSPKCQRYIMSFGADKPFVENGMEWVRLRVMGQSFLLHHIRKMIGTACEVVAGTTPVETIARAFQPDKMDLPKAPSVGLYMAQAHFESYNNKLEESVQTSHPALDFKGDVEVCARIEQFKKDFVFQHIVSHEERTRTYAKWIKLLAHSLPFDYVARPLEQWKREKTELSVIQSRRKRIEAEKEMRKREAGGEAVVDGDDRVTTAVVGERVSQEQDDDGDVSE